MTDEIQTPQTDKVGRERGGRKAGSAAPGGDGAACLPEVDQTLTAGDILQGSAQAIVPVPFDFQGKAVRTIAKGDDNIWFVPTDACALLEHSNPRVAIGGPDDDQKGVSIICTSGGQTSLV